MFWQACYACPLEWAVGPSMSFPPQFPCPGPGHTTGWRGLSLVGRDSAPHPPLQCSEREKEG